MSNGAELRECDLIIKHPIETNSVALFEISHIPETEPVTRREF